jgi:methionyl aminopeptidase
MKEKEIADYKKAGEIAKQVTEYARKIIKPDMFLLEIAEKIESKIIELGAKPAFPVNLSINEIAAHYTPHSTDETKANGLLKVDIGVHVNGSIADTAFSLDLTAEKKYKELMQASQEAIDNVLESIKSGITLSDIGKTIQETIEKKGFTPIINLSGHELGNFIIHAGLTIPNHDNNSQVKIKDGAYAIEPFATTGHGQVYDGAKSSIYRFEKQAGVRDSKAREIYHYILENYKTLPFCERWITKKFSSGARLALSFLENAGILYNYPQLIEKSHSPVSQAEHTIIINKDKIEVTTR